MKSTTQFVLGATGLVLLGAMTAAAALDSAGDRAVLAASILVLGTQLPAHVLLKAWKRRNDRFLAAMVAGFALRVAVLIAGLFVFALPGRVEPVPFLAALGGFLVATVILESAIEHRRVRMDPAASEPG